MAKAFNLTAQINLQGPANIRPIVSNIKKQFSNIKADLKLNIDPKANTKIASITKGIQTLTTSIDTATISINKLNIGLSSLGSSLGKIQSISGTVNSSIDKVASSSKSVKASTKQAATAMEGFGGSVALAAKRFAAFSAATTVIYGLINSINDAVTEFLVYDRELVRLTQVTGGTISQFTGLSVGVQDISNEVRRLSTTLGVSSQELIKVASTLAQAGLTATETKVALEALAKSALAPSFENITQTTEGAIAALRQFGLGVGELESALGSINQVAADFAVESDDIIKAIQRTGGVFASASRGVSSGTDALNEFIAVFTSVRATTRESAETIATGLRTIFTRIQRGSTVDALKELGVELRDSEGKFVGAFEAVKRLSEGLSGIDPRSGTFAEIVEELGGFRQIGKVIPLIQQFETAQKALTSAQRGTNSLTKASEIAFYSLENQLAKTREEFLALIADFANTGTVKAFTTATLGLARGFISVVGALKPLIPLITTLATIKLSQKIGEFRTGFTNKLFGGDSGSAILSASPTEKTSSTTSTLGVSENTTALKNLTTSINNLSAIIKSRPVSKGFATGGLVGGVGSRDTVPAMLTPGEFVIRKKAVESIGANNLDNINKYGLGGIVTEKGSDLIQLYPSLSNKIDPESEYSANVIPKMITKKNTALIGNMIKNKRQNMALETWRNFELALSQAYGLFYDTSSGAYLDFPKKPGDAKFLKEGERNRTDDLRGNNNETMLAKLIGADRYKMNNTNNVSAYYPENPKQIDGIISSYVGGKNKERTKYGRFEFAGGGSIEDTVPALLTRGEFVIQKDAAQKLGSATLHRMNNADKLQGYNRGGYIQKFARGGRSSLKSVEGYNEQELLDAVLYYQGGSGPLARAMVNQDYIFVDREEAYDTSDVVSRLKAASQYKAPKKLYSGLGRGQYREILKDANIQESDLVNNLNQSLAKLQGQTIDFPTFLSTSTLQKVAKSFIGDPGALMNIDASQSEQKVLDILKAKKTPTQDVAEKSSRRLPGIDKLSDAKLSGYDFEKEFVLPPSVKFRINSAKVMKQTGPKGKGLVKSGVDDEGLSQEDYYAQLFDQPPQKPFEYDLSNLANISFGEGNGDVITSSATSVGTIGFDLPSLNLQAQMLNRGGAIQQLKFGGSPEDTVPALLTPGEFVIRKEAAQKLGSATLHKMNNADKLQGYNRGGFVGGTPVQKFADGDFVPAPLNKASPGNIEAYVQKILMSLEKAVKAAEKQTYDTARASGQSAKEAVKLAKQAGIEAARKEASRITSAVTERGGATRYKETAQIENAKKRMVEAIESGKDPSIKGKTERRRTPGYLLKDTPDTEASITKASEKTDKFGNNLTNTILILTNTVMPQLKSFADSIKTTDTAFVSAAAQAAELGASLALSTSLGLQALEVDKKITKNAALAAGIAGAAGGGLQAFASKSIENTIKENSKALSAFDKTLKDVTEAPTIQLQVEAAAQLEKDFNALAKSTFETTAAISDYEWYEKFGTAITDSTSTYIALSTSLIAVQQAAGASAAALRTQAAAASASAAGSAVGGAAAAAGGAAAAAGGAKAASGFFSFISKAVSALAKFNVYLQLIVGAISIGISVWSVFSKSTGRASEQLDRFGKALEDMVKNGNDYSLANRRFVNELSRYSKISANLDEQIRTGAITKIQRKEIENRIFGGSEKVTNTGSVQAGGGLNEFNLALDQFIRTEARMKGITIESTKSLQDTLNSLDKTTESFKVLTDIIASVGDTNSDLMKNFQKIMFIRSFTNPIEKGAQSLSQVEAESLYNRTSESERNRISKEYVVTLNKQSIATKNLVLAQRSAALSALNFIDVLNNVNSALSRIGTDFSNAIDDASYRLELFTSEGANIRPDTSAARSIEILRNLPAFGTVAFGQAEGQQQLDDAITKALAPLRIEQSPNRELRANAETLRGSIKALRELEVKAPQALRNFISTREAGVDQETSGLRTILKDILKPLDLKSEFQGTLLDEIIASVDKSLSGEGTKSIEELTNSFPSLVRNTDSFKAALETTIKSLETQDLKNKKLAEAANATAAALQKVTNLQIRAAELRMNTELEISQIRGRTPGLRELNAPFDATIRKLTQSIGGVSDPEAIVKGINDNTNKLIAGGEDTEALKGFASNINDLKQALNMLGDKNARLVNALDKLRQVEEERKGVGSIFEEMLKASTDPIARMDIEATLSAAARVKAGGTNINDVNTTLQKFIPMLEKSGPAGVQEAEKLRNQILTTAAVMGKRQQIEAGDIQGAKQTDRLINMFSDAVSSPLARLLGIKSSRQEAEETARKEAKKAEGSMSAQAEMMKKEIDRFGVSVGDATTEFRDNFAKVWPGIIYEMKQFQAELTAINLKNTTVNFEDVDFTKIYEIINKNLDDILSITKTDVALKYGDIGIGSSGKSLGVIFGLESEKDRSSEILNSIPDALKGLFELSDELDKYGIKTGKQIVKQKNIEGIAPKDLIKILDALAQPIKTFHGSASLFSNFRTPDPESMKELKIQQENLQRKIGPPIEPTPSQQQDRAKRFLRLFEQPQSQVPAIPSARTPTLPGQTQQQLQGIPPTKQQPVTQPISSPTMGGGQFSVPPEVVRPTPTAAAIPKLDFDYNDFITKFNRAFDSQTGKFREAVGSLSLSFQALNPPVDKFSSSVTKLIDGLNAINDAGGIKGPTIPEKVTVEVVFNEDLTIDTSRINNNDLLNQIGVVTSQAINDRIAELKLTGK